jgi:hypothetical protein
MPLDTLGRTRATMACAESLFEVCLERTGCLVDARGQLLVLIGGEVTLVSRPRETVAERLRQSKIHAVIWDWGLQLLPMNEEFPVSAIHHIALITSLPFVHTARRYYRLEVLVRHLDLPSIGEATLLGWRGSLSNSNF